MKTEGLSQSDALTAAVNSTISDDNLLDASALDAVLSKAIATGVTHDDVCKAQEQLSSAYLARGIFGIYSEQMAKQGNEAKATEYAYGHQRMFAAQAAWEKTLSRLSAVAGEPDDRCFATK
jgi:hypothetical protein